MQLSGDIQQEKRSSQSKTLATRKTRSTTNKKNEMQNPKKSPIMNSSKSKPISVGNSYQVLELPECNCRQEPNDNTEEEKDECLWSKRQGKLRDEQILEFCRDALNNYGLDNERALYILQRSDHNLNKAKSELYSRSFVKGRFSDDDAFAFRDAHIYFGKNFVKIRQVLPHKTLSALVEHYYLTKKQQNYKSFTDNEWVKKNATSESDSEEQTQVKSELHGLFCEGCHNEVSKLYSANGLELCRACKNYFKATNKHRVCTRLAEDIRRVPTCHQEMRHIAEQFEAMAGTGMGKQFEDVSNGSGEVQVEHRTETVCEQKIQIVTKAQKKLRMEAANLQKKLMTTTSKRNQSAVDEARKFVQNTAITAKGQRVRMTHIWSDTEKSVTLNALVRFDSDYKIVAEVIGTKTADMVKSFCEKNRDEIRKIIGERRKRIDEKIQAENELRKKCNDQKVHEIVVVED